MLAGLTLALCAALLSPATARAQTALVKNTGQTESLSVTVGILSSFKYSQAQQFTTGGNSAGYELGSVQLDIGDFQSTDEVRVSIYSDSSGSPGSSLHVLTNPSTLSAALDTFTAPADTTLTSDTAYHVVVEAPSGSFSLDGTESNNEDAGAASGWSIADDRHNRSSDTGSWGTHTRKLRMAVNGTAVPDTTAPTVAAILSLDSSPTKLDTLIWTVGFDENVENVDAADFSVTGTSATLSVMAQSGSTSFYDVTASGGDLADLNGEVTLSFAATQNIQDLAGNALTNTTPPPASDTRTVVVDNTAPTVTSVERQDPASTPTNSDTLKWRVTLNEDFGQAQSTDFSVAGTTATLEVVGVGVGFTPQVDVTASGGNLAGLDATVTLSFTTSHNIIDFAGNALTNTTPTGTNDNTYVVDNTAPTVAISDVPSASSAPFTAKFRFSQAVNGFALADITVGNGAASAFMGADGDTEYSALVTPTANGTVTVDVAAAAAADLAGNASTAAPRASSTYTASNTDTTAPTVTSVVRQDPASTPTNSDTLKWRVTFSESVKNVGAADFSVAGTTATPAVAAVAGSTSQYDVTASGGDLAGLDATVTLSFATGQDIEDMADNALANTTPTGTNDSTYVVDNTAPTVAISDVPSASSAPFTAKFTFSQAVNGFALADITVGNGAASAFMGADGDTEYTALVTPTANGTVTVDVAAGAAADRAGNASTAAARVSSTYTAPESETPGALRLEGGSVAHEGRVEMYYDAQWGTVCDDFWDHDNATVACRALGYANGSDGSILRRAFFGRGSGPIQLDDVQCRGDETSLLACPRRHNRAVGSHNCSHREDVSVRCVPNFPSIAQAPGLSAAPGSDGQWGPGETLKVTLTFSEAVTVTTTEGTPNLEVRLGDSVKRRAAYSEGSGTTQLVFTHELEPGDGVHTSAHAIGDSLALDGGFVQSAATGQNALLDHAGASIAGTPSTTPALTASFANVPDSHLGPGHRFRFHVNFSHAVTMSYVNMRDDVLSMLPTHGTVEKARRLAPPSNKGWEITIMPTSYDDIVITLPATGDCTDDSAVCTSGGQKLSDGISTLVAGLPAASISDATVHEGPGAQLRFVVTLSRALGPRQSDAVRYRTVDGTAKAGEDYVASSSYVFFGPGVTTRTLSIPVKDDSIDEGEETMTVELSQFSNGGRYGIRIEDGTGVGTIVNSDPMPKAWLARFGRTVGEQVVDTVTRRLDTVPDPGVQLNVAGRTFGTFTGDTAGAGTGESIDEAQARHRRLVAQLEAERRSEGDGISGPEPVSMSGREILAGMSLSMTGGSEEGGFASLWAGSAVSNFEGREDDLKLDGEVTSAMLGADFVTERITTGLILAHSEGEGSYLSDTDAGEVSSTLTGLYPTGATASPIACRCGARSATARAC